MLRHLAESDGLPEVRLSAAGFAATHPLLPDSDPASVSVNRRVDIVVLSDASTEANAQLIDDAMAEGVESIDLTYELPAEVGSAAQQLGELLDLADRYCESGQYLLTLTTPPAALEYRSWYLQQFVGQAAGEPAESFADWRARQATAAP